LGADLWVGLLVWVGSSSSSLPPCLAGPRHQPENDNSLSLGPLLQLQLVSIIAQPSAYSSECTSGGECLNQENECSDASAFDHDESVLPLLRGSIDTIVSHLGRTRIASHE